MPRYYDRGGRQQYAPEVGGIEYIERTDPAMTDRLGQAISGRQERHDVYSQALSEAIAKYGDIPAPAADREAVGKYISEWEEGLRKGVEEDYGGDYGLAGKEVVAEIARQRRILGQVGQEAQEEQRYKQMYDQLRMSNQLAQKYDPETGQPVEVDPFASPVFELQDGQLVRTGQRNYGDIRQRTDYLGWAQNNLVNKLNQDEKTELFTRIDQATGNKYNVDPSLYFVDERTRGYAQEELKNMIDEGKLLTDETINRFLEDTSFGFEYGTAKDTAKEYLAGILMDQVSQSTVASAREDKMAIASMEAGPEPSFMRGRQQFAQPLQVQQFGEEHPEAQKTLNKIEKTSSIVEAVKNFDVDGTLRLRSLIEEPKGPEATEIKRTKVKDIAPSELKRWKDGKASWADLNKLIGANIASLGTGVGYGIRKAGEFIKDTYSSVEARNERSKELYKVFGVRTDGEFSTDVLGRVDYRDVDPENEQQQALLNLLMPEADKYNLSRREDGKIVFNFPEPSGLEFSVEKENRKVVNNALDRITTILNDTVENWNEHLQEEEEQLNEYLNTHPYVNTVIAQKADHKGENLEGAVSYETVKEGVQTMINTQEAMLTKHSIPVTLNSLSRERAQRNDEDNRFTEYLMRNIQFLPEGALTREFKGRRDKEKIQEVKKSELTELLNDHPITGARLDASNGKLQVLLSGYPDPIYLDLTKGKGFLPLDVVNKVTEVQEFLRKGRSLEFEEDSYPTVELAGITYQYRPNYDPETDTAMPEVIGFDSMTGQHIPEVDEAELMKAYPALIFYSIADLPY